MNSEDRRVLPDLGCHDTNLGDQSVGGSCDQREQLTSGAVLAVESRSCLDGLAALLMVVEGPQDTWKVVRTLMGVTNPRDAAPGTIRGDLAVELTENLVHGSDGPESAEREIGIFFPGL